MPGWIKLLLLEQTIQHVSKEILSGQAHELLSPVPLVFFFSLNLSPLRKTGVEWLVFVNSKCLSAL